LRRARSLASLPTNKKGEVLSNLSLFLKPSKNYFFFLGAFLAGAFFAAFFLAAMENHPLIKSRVPREIVQKTFGHCVRNKFFLCLRQM
jgi:hypothetical protein